MRAEVAQEFLLTDVVVLGREPSGPLMPLAPPPAEQACRACRKTNRRLWHGICAWCCAPEEESGGR